MEVDEQESMGNACEFALLSIRNMIIPPVDMINSNNKNTAIEIYFIILLSNIFIFNFNF